MRVLGGVAMMAAVFALSCASAGDTEDETGAPDAAVVAPPPDAAPGGGCGDGTCDIGAGECQSCPADCTTVCGGGAPDAGAVCGDMVCNGDESCDWCAFDCGACPGVCGDGTCSVDEDCTSCEADCGACPTSSCGDLVCDMAGGECASCPADCLGLCGGGGGGACAHDKCDIGGPLASDCDPCVEVICSLDLYCCLVEWDVSCKNAVFSACAESC